MREYFSFINFENPLYILPTSMEDNLNERHPEWRQNQWKTIQWKTNSMVHDLNGRHPQWKTISMEDNIKEALQEADDISLPR